MYSHIPKLTKRIHEAFAASSAAMYPARGTPPVHAEPIHGSARALPREQFDQRFQAAETSSQATLPAEQGQRLEDMHQMHASPVHASGAPLAGDEYVAERFALAQSGPRVVLSPEEQLVIEELDRIQIGVSADRLAHSQSVNAGRSEEVDAYLTWFEREFGFFGRALGRGGRRLTAIPQFNSARILMQRANDVGLSLDDILQGEAERYGVDSIEDLPFSYQVRLDALARYEAVYGEGEAERLEYIREASEALASAQSVLAMVAQIEMSDAANRFRDGTLANADNSVMGTLRAFIDDPLNGAAFLTETAAESLPLLAVAGGASLATGQPLVGAAVLAGGSFLEESSTAALQWLADNDVDISTPEAAAAALQNGDLMRQAQAHGLTRGVIIALFDAMSGGIAGRTLARSPAGDLVLQGLAQAALGASGEAAASYATTGEVNARDAVIEGLADGVTTPATVLAMRGPEIFGARAEVEDGTIAPDAPDLDARSINTDISPTNSPSLSSDRHGDVEVLGPRQSDIDSAISQYGPISEGLPVPQWLTEDQFLAVSSVVRDHAAQIGLGDDIFVQGSRARGTALPSADIDIAIRVSPERFAEIVNDPSIVRKRIYGPNPNSSASRTRDHAIAQGIIHAREARLSRLADRLEQQLGFLVQISIIRADGPFDNGPQTPLFTGIE